MAQNEKTGKKVAKIAAKVLSDPKTPKPIRSIAASVLSQAPDKKKPKK